MGIGRQISDIRKGHQLTQEKFGELFHVTRQTVSNWENEKSYPDLQTCYHAALGGTNDDESYWLSVFSSHIPQIVVSLFQRHRYTTEHVVTPGDPEPGNLSVAAVLPAQMIGAFKPVYL